MACSLDGFIAGPDDDLEWLNEPEPVQTEPTEALEFGAFMAQVGCMLMGRRTYDVVSGFGKWFYGDVPVHVVTHRPLEPVVETVRAVTGDIEQLVSVALETAGGKDVYLDGGNLVRQALDAGLVDELIITTMPILLAGGVPLFDGLLRRQSLEFVAHHSYGNKLQIIARPVK